MAPRRIDALEKFTSATVGDGKSPNLFFVSEQGTNVMIARSFQPAYDYWRSLPSNAASALEDRQYGCIASVDTDEENPGRLVRRDDSYTYLKGRRVR